MRLLHIILRVIIFRGSIKFVAEVVFELVDIKM